MPTFRTSLKLIEPSNAQTPRERELFLAGRQAGKGMLPNMYKAMLNSPAMLASYLHGYERFREESSFSPPEQEVVFLAISEENGCDYCMAAHSLLADTVSRVPRDVTDAIRNGDDVPDTRLAALAKMTREMLLSRGRPDEQDVRGFLAAGFEERQLLDIVLAISIKTLSNYANHLFDTPLDTVFKAREYTAYKAAQRVVEFFAPRRP